MSMLEDATRCAGKAENGWNNYLSTITTGGEETKQPLSARIRPNCEAAPWVIEEVKILEEELRKALIAREYKYADYAAVLPVGGYGSESMDSAFYAGFFAARELKEK